jgi:hypothetical protein
LKAEFDRQDFPVALAPSHSFRLNPLAVRLYTTSKFELTRATLPVLMRLLAPAQGNFEPNNPAQ